MVKMERAYGWDEGWQIIAALWNLGRRHFKFRYDGRTDTMRIEIEGDDK